MKVHPKGSCLRFKKENYIDYLKMCERLDWPVCIHTEQDGYSNVEYVYEVAKQFPNIKFVMVHMELSTDHRNAIQLIEKLPNLFGDTTLVDLQTVQKAITYCGSNKILFGTDAPVFGESSYKRYDNYLQQLKLFFSQEEIENVFYQNAKNIFHLKEEF
jgi:predicted TIM-barrel fold metal-dependent hydrolase